MRRNDEYLATCKNGGKGKCAKLYEDFGDVRGDSFKDWWLEGGRNVRCFAEPPTPTIRLIDPKKVVEQVSEGELLLAVPLDLPMQHLVKRFRETVAQHHDGKRGVTASRRSQAKYPVHGKVDVNFLEDALRLWDARLADPTKPIWMLVQELRLVESKHWVRDSDTKKTAASAKNVMTATGSRLLKKADLLIRNCASGRFPVSKPNS